jgi:hypothetical protein
MTMASKVLVVRMREYPEADDEEMSVIAKLLCINEMDRPTVFVDNGRVGMHLLDSYPAIRRLPLGRSLVLTAMATLLAAADWLPENRFVDRDHLEFWLSLTFGLSAILMAIRDRGVRIDVAAWRNRLILLAITLTITAAAGEVMTRWYFRNVTTSADNGGYFSRRWNRLERIRLNPAGFRERPFVVDKPRGVYRIAVVGDSFTYGNGIRQEDRYSDVLQAHLPSHFEVLNFGVAGANTPEHRQLVQHLLEDITPDFILLQWYVNDVEDDDSSGRPTFHSLAPAGWLHNWLNANSALYTIANMQWAETQAALGMTVSYTDYLHHRLGDPNSTDSTRDRELLRDLIAITQRAHVAIGMVLFPDTAAMLDARYPFGYLHDRTLAVCAEREITCLDLRSAFAQVKDVQTLWANRLDHHPSAAANAIAAEKILETFSGIWAASH